VKTIRKPNLLLLVALAFILTACAQIAAAQPQSEAAPQGNAGTPVKCLRDSETRRLLVNVVQGYCLQYPAEYDIAFPNESEVMMIKGSMLNVSEPVAQIEVKPAEGVTLEQVADQIAADYAIPGMEVTRNDLTIGGEPAVMLDGLSGTVIKTFTFRTETNVCPDCPESTEPAGVQSHEDPNSAMISGWVWHDTCASGRDGVPQPVNTPEGCVQDDSSQGLFHADGEMAVGEPLIEGVVVSLGEGACPSTGLAEQSTITTDLSYSFTGLKAGTYCVSIDPQREPTFSILRPGLWTYPTISQGVISTTISLEPGEYKGMVNFGWDYQFKP
jgi:hypothetical protein